MANYFNTSVGKKYLVSISGLFLISFLIVHLTVNLFLLVGQEAYNFTVLFMTTNTIIGIIEPLLAVGFLVHIGYSAILTVSNRYARPQKYEIVDQRETSSWTSRNMFVLGGFVLIFLFLHLSNFWYKMKFGEVEQIESGGIMVKDAYSMVKGKFIIWWYALAYIAGAVFLGLHLLHGFQSAFQSIGLNNDLWRKRFTFLGTLFSLIIAAGFSIIPLWFFFENMLR
jgi:succinate dehydrogenase / fumarate reductase, cytochrome b subunit